MRRLLFIALVSLVSCSVGVATGPDLVATVENLVEYDDGYLKTGHVAVKLENQSDVPVFSFTIALSLETDRNTYYQTVYDDRGVPPQTIIWLNLEIPYFDVGELATIEGVEITDFYFE